MNNMTEKQWQIPQPVKIPDSFLHTVNEFINLPTKGKYISQLLWQRGIIERDDIAQFLYYEYNQSVNPFKFGEEMQWAVERVKQAIENQEKIVIWGDFDADGITGTAVLWDGLKQIIPPENLSYYIPNRLTESHGLNIAGIARLSQQKVNLIITVDTGSTNIAEIEFAQQLGIDVIVTDHHTLPPERPAVVAIINPRYLLSEDPLYNLSGVGVAYKFMEALGQSLPEAKQLNLESLLDLVAIGLIADLVKLTGESRFLVQKGLQKLKEQLTTRTRPGVAKLLELCQKTGDRPTDISFGIGPRINAVSRLSGDANFCVELLTSQDVKYCHQLAEETELANTRRKALQKDILESVQKQLNKLDLSTTSVIVLNDAQWPVGVLGLVANQIAQEYGRPTILLTTGNNHDFPSDNNSNINDSSNNLTDQSSPVLARGSARSVESIDLYELVKDQANLLHKFGGHPFAAGLSLPVENLPLFTESINQQLKQKSFDPQQCFTTLKVDLIVNVSELGRDLFQELKLLEPCGMGNPVPKLLIKNCWFDNAWNKKQNDLKNKKVAYIKTTFQLKDDTNEQTKNEGFAGIWWGHYADELPPPAVRCDVIVELDGNTYKEKTNYQVRLIDWRYASDSSDNQNQDTEYQSDQWIIDWRNRDIKLTNLDELLTKFNSELLVDLAENTQEQLLEKISPYIIKECPISWDDLRIFWQKLNNFSDAYLNNSSDNISSNLSSNLSNNYQTKPPFIIAYSGEDDNALSPLEVWQNLVGIAKYLHRYQEGVTRQKLRQKLGISEVTIQIGFRCLQKLGCQIKYENSKFYFDWQSVNHANLDSSRLVNQGKNLINPSLQDHQTINNQTINTDIYENFDPEFEKIINQFILAVKEEKFRRQYFSQVPINIIQSMATTWQKQLTLQQQSSDDQAIAF
jgi:single-stranded-DNA-specific exonuclease